MVLKGPGEVGEDGKNNVPVPSSGHLAPAGHRPSAGHLFHVNQTCHESRDWEGTFAAKSKLRAEDHLCSATGYVIRHRAETALLSLEHRGNLYPGSFVHAEVSFGVYREMECTMYLSKKKSPHIQVLNFMAQVQRREYWSLLSLYEGGPTRRNRVELTDRSSTPEGSSEQMTPHLDS